MWAFWVVFGVVALVLVLAMVKIERRRLDAHVGACHAAAAKIGASYSHEAPEGLLPKVEGFDLTYADANRLPQSLRDVFTVRDAARTLHIFLHEHRGTLPAGTGAAGAMTQRETVACVVSPRLRLPRFRLSPRRLAEKIASLVGFRDVDFDSHPHFSRLYFLNTEDEGAVRRLFQPSALNFFENHPGLHVEGRGDTLLVYRQGQTVPLDDLPQALRTAETVAGFFLAPS